MGKDSAIEWTTHTWNPWQGCHKVSAGCKNCYMFREKERYGQDPATVVRSKHNTFFAPFKWTEPAKVFTCSWSDFFIEEADPWRADAWNVIRDTPQLTYQILTKRPERIAECLPMSWGEGWPGVWLGVTAEDQNTADERIPQLLKIPAAVRFVSVEPMLGPVNLAPYLSIKLPDGTPVFSYRQGLKAGLDWVICGCESGPSARPADIEWAASLMYQCQDSHTPFFFKQWIFGTKNLVKLPPLKGKVWDQFPEAAHV